MTDAERLQRQAAEKEELATTFDRHARELGSIFMEIPTSPGARKEFWTGPAADRYTSQAHQMDRGVDQLREACTTTAHNLRKSAEQLRKQAAQSPSTP